MPVRRALVVGVGIAGLATALRLVRSDWEVVVVERGSGAHHVGFPHALRGFGHQAAARFGLLPALRELGQPRCYTVLVDAAGTPLAVLSDPCGKTPVLCRDDVVAVLRNALGKVEIRRHREPLGLAQDDCGVTVTFPDGTEDWFDLVVGADGADSQVRDTAFHARQPQHPTYTTVTGRVGGTPVGAVSMQLAGRSMLLRPLHDGSSAVLFAWRDVPAAPLRDVFGNVAGLVPGLLSQVDDETQDRRTRHQVHVDHRASQQIALVGDAAWCMGFHDDHSASLSIGAAELLGDALDICTGIAKALRWWESQMRPVVRHARRHSATLRGPRPPRRDRSPSPSPAVVRIE